MGQEPGEKERTGCVRNVFWGTAYEREEIPRVI